MDEYQDVLQELLSELYPFILSDKTYYPIALYLYKNIIDSYEPSENSLTGSIRDKKTLEKNILAHNEIIKNKIKMFKLDYLIFKVGLSENDFHKIIFLESTDHIDELLCHINNVKTEEEKIFFREIKLILEEKIKLKNQNISNFNEFIIKFIKNKNPYKTNIAELIQKKDEMQNTGFSELEILTDAKDTNEDSRNNRSSISSFNSPYNSRFHLSKAANRATKNIIKLIVRHVADLLNNNENRCLPMYLEGDINKKYSCTDYQYVPSEKLTTDQLFQDIINKITTDSVKYPKNLKLCFQSEEYKKNFLLDFCQKNQNTVCFFKNNKGYNLYQNDSDNKFVIFYCCINSKIIEVTNIDIDNFNNKYHVTLKLKTLEKFLPSINTNNFRAENEVSAEEILHEIFLNISENTNRDSIRSKASLV